jgi:hypothetical protein
MLPRKRRNALAAPARKGHRRSRPSVEVLEGRALLADFAGMASGIFVDPSSGTTTGSGTSSFTYGRGFEGSAASSLSFTGGFFGAPSETPFSLGRLSFGNGQTVSGTDVSSVSLSVTVNLSNPAGVSAQTFTFPLQISTTSNSRDNPQDDASRDSVFFPSSFSPQVFTTADGSRFTLQLVGFQNASPGGATATERFLVREGESASAELRARFVTPPAVLPDIQVVSAQSDASGMVTFGYGVQGNSGTFTVGLYQSADTTFDPSDELVVPRQTITPALNASAQGTFTLPAQFSADPNRPNLLVVADPPNPDPLSPLKPRGDVLESNEDNNVAVVAQGSLPDIHVISAVLDSSTSTVKFRYTTSTVPRCTSSHSCYP